MPTANTGLRRSIRTNQASLTTWISHLAILFGTFIICAVAGNQSVLSQNKSLAGLSHQNLVDIAGLAVEVDADADNLLTINLEGKGIVLL